MYSYHEKEALAAGADYVLTKYDEAYRIPEVIQQVVLGAKDSQNEIPA
jgi:hypothetical protein